MLSLHVCINIAGVRLARSERLEDNIYKNVVSEKTLII